MIVFVGVVTVARYSSKEPMNPCLFMKATLIKFSASQTEQTNMKIEGGLSRRRKMDEKEQWG